MKKFGNGFLHTHPGMENRVGLDKDHVIVDKDEYTALVDTLNEFMDKCRDGITLTEAAAGTSSDRVRSKANLMNHGYKETLRVLNEILGNEEV